MQPDRNVDAWFRNDPSWSIHCFEHTANEQYSNYTRHSKRAHSNPWNANGESSALLVECFPFLPLRRTRKTNQFIFVFSKQISRVYSPKSTAHTVSSRIIIHFPKTQDKTSLGSWCPNPCHFKAYLFAMLEPWMDLAGLALGERLVESLFVCVCILPACNQSWMNPFRATRWIEMVE